MNKGSAYSSTIYYTTTTITTIKAINSRLSALELACVRLCVCVFMPSSRNSLWCGYVHMQFLEFGWICSLCVRGSTVVRRKCCATAVKCLCCVCFVVRACNDAWICGPSCVWWLYGNPHTRQPTYKFIYIYKYIYYMYE